VGGAGLGDQHEALTGRRPPGAPGGGRGRVEDGAALVQQHPAGGGEGRTLAVALQQRHAQAALHPLDRPGERRLGHAQAGGGAPEVQLLGDGHEVPQLAHLQLVHRSILRRS
jgi:hypothetical protein